MIKKILRRIIIFPIMVLVFPLAVVIGWLMINEETFSSIYKHCLEVLKETW